MKLPARSSMGAQDCYPMQAEGGFTGNIHQSVHAALVAWEKRRGNNAHFRFGKGNGVYRKAKTVTATREDISWNEAPEIKRAPCPRKKAQLTQDQKDARNKAIAESRRRETPEQREARLAKRNAWYRAKVGEKPKRPKMSATERKIAVKQAKKRYMERIRLGLIPKEKPKSKLTLKQLEAKAARARRYYQENKKSA